MTLGIIVRTTEYRGDHSSDVGIAIEALPGETVDALVERARTVAGLDKNSAKLGVDWIEIRQIRVSA